MILRDANKLSKFINQNNTQNDRYHVFIELGMGGIPDLLPPLLLDSTEINSVLMLKE